MRNWFAALAVGVMLVPGLVRAEEGVQVTGAYAVVTMENAPNAAVFFDIVNAGPVDDRLIAAASDIAAKAELHTHAMSADGMMQMLPIEGGIPVATGATHALARGGDHVMLMGLTQPMPEGTQFTLTLTFEQAGKIVVVVPVQGAATMDPKMDHSGHGQAAPASE